jgi:galactokinase
MEGKALLVKLRGNSATELFASLYGASGVEAARSRYALLVEELVDPAKFPVRELSETTGDLRVFTAAGRTELGGNHTDHNRGKVLAASIQLDAVAVVAARKDKRIFFRSAGHPDVSVDLADPSGLLDLAPHPEETGTTEALVRGIAAQFASRGIEVGGFTANAASTVASGSGLSSSAAVEVLFGKIFDNLFCNGSRAALEIAQIGQKAENDYFGKPCGLMDQVACASGGVVAIDFTNKVPTDSEALAPQVSTVSFDPASHGYALCVVNTRGTHADLTPDYAAIPAEMHAVARFFGKSVLREISRDAVLAHVAELRKVCGDRAILRALHFFDENDRVDAMLKALESRNVAT